MTDKIIIIRGNSGSGKTTVAKELCKRLGNSNVMLLSQDVVRREILHAKDGQNNKSIDLFKMMIDYGKDNSEFIILEGIFNSNWYKLLFDFIKDSFTQIYSYYYDISFEETIRRHCTKQIADFTVNDMKRWWNDKDYLYFENEVILTENLSCGDVVDMIFNDIGVLNQKIECD